MNVLKCEFIKLKKSMAFKVTGLVMLCVSVLHGLIMVNFGGYDGVSMMLTALSDNMTYILLGGIIAGLFICNDFENRTFQESITCGNSHLSVIASKAFVYTLSSIIVSLPYPIVSSAIVAAKYGWGFDAIGASGAELVTRMALLLGSIFCTYLPVAMLFVMVCFLVQKTGISFAINIPGTMLGMIAMQMVQQYVFPESKIFAKIYEYSFVGIFSTPFKYLGGEEGSNMLANVTLENYLPIIIASIAWAVLFFTIAAVSFKKRDLK